MAVQTYKVSSIKNPMGSGYLGLVTGVHFDGTPLTIYSTDEAGEMICYDDPACAQIAMNDFLFALADFRFKPGSEINSKNLSKLAMMHRKDRLTPGDGGVDPMDVPPNFWEDK